MRRKGREWTAEGTTENARQTDDSFYSRRAVSSTRKKNRRLYWYYKLVRPLLTCGLQKKSTFRFSSIHTFRSRVYAIVMASALRSVLPASRIRRASAPRRTAESLRAAACAPPRCPRRVAPLTMAARGSLRESNPRYALFASHEAMMYDTHVIGEAEADDIGHLARMLEYEGREVHRALGPLDAGTVARSPPHRHPRGI